MTMIDIHNKASSREGVLYHEFISSFKKTAKVVYGFVEGQEDPSFYRGAIDKSLPEGWESKIKQAGGKRRVINLYKMFDWRRFNKSRIVFFIDRDLSDFLHEKLPKEKNIYITEEYSIENHIFNRYTCGVVLTDICNLNKISEAEKNSVLKLFEEQHNEFCTAMETIMSWIIHWRRQGEEACLDNIKMKDIFKVLKGKLQVRSRIGNCACPVEYIHSKCKIDYDSNVDISDIKREFKKASGRGKFVRGKYKSWFFVEFILSIYKNITEFSTEYDKPPKMYTTLNSTSIIILVAPRANIPEALRGFLDSTCIRYVSSVT